MRAKGLEGLTARIGRLGPGSPRLPFWRNSSAPSSEDLLPNSLPGAPSCAIAAWSHLQANPSLCLTGVPSTATSAQPHSSLGRGATTPAAPAVADHFWRALAGCLSLSRRRPGCAGQSAGAPPGHLPPALGSPLRRLGVVRSVSREQSPEGPAPSRLVHLLAPRYTSEATTETQVLRGS